MRPAHQWCPTCGHVNSLPSETLEEYLAVQPSARGPRELNFHGIKLYTHDDNAILRGIKSDRLILPVGAFLTNIRRLKGLLEMPADVLFCGGLVALAHQEGGDFMENFRRARESKEMADTRRRDGDLAFSMTVLQTGTDLWHGIEAILIAQITGAWTAFEVLAGDLWEQSLNTSPSLAILDGRVPGNTQPKGQRDDARQVSVVDLRRNKFNVSDKMGAILRVKFSFTKLESAREAYFRAFHDPAVRVAIDDPCFTVLAKLRNVIVHKAAFADKEFFEEFKAHPLFSGKITEGKKIPIDGVLVRKVIAPAMTATITLIQAVDDWLSKHA